LDCGFANASLAFQFKLRRLQFGHLRIRFMSLFRSQLFSKLLSQPADFPPERNVVDFGRTWITGS
jgi:hypothetical protein